MVVAWVPSESGLAVGRGSAGSRFRHDRVLVGRGRHGVDRVVRCRGHPVRVTRRHLRRRGDRGDAGERLAAGLVDAELGERIVHHALLGAERLERRHRQGLPQVDPVPDPLCVGERSGELGVVRTGPVGLRRGLADERAAGVVSLPVPLRVVDPAGAEVASASQQEVRGTRVELGGEVAAHDGPAEQPVEPRGDPCAHRDRLAPRDAGAGQR